MGPHINSGANGFSAQSKNAIRNLLARRSCISTEFPGGSTLTPTHIPTRPPTLIPTLAPSPIPTFISPTPIPTFPLPTPIPTFPLFLLVLLQHTTFLLLILAHVVMVIGATKYALIPVFVAAKRVSVALVVNFVVNEAQKIS